MTGSQEQAMRWVVADIWSLLWNEYDRFDDLMIENLMHLLGDALHLDTMLHDPDAFGYQCDVFPTDWEIL